MFDAFEKIDWVKLSLGAGVVLLLVGVQLRMVESYVCTPEATAVLSDWFGPAPNTAQGALQGFVVKTTSPRHVFTPPAWSAWAFISVGAVLVMNGLLRRMRKSN